jgi:hypothetical protein
MPPISYSQRKNEDPNNYSGCNSTPWHPELTVLNLVVDPLKTETISIKRHEYQSAQSSYQPHDLTYQSFCKTHVSHDNNTLSSIAETNSRDLDAFNRCGQKLTTWKFKTWHNTSREPMKRQPIKHVSMTEKGIDLWRKNIKPFQCHL